VLSLFAEEKLNVRFDLQNHFLGSGARYFLLTN